MTAIVVEPHVSTPWAPTAVPVKRDTLVLATPLSAVSWQDSYTHIILYHFDFIHKMKFLCATLHRLY